MTTSARSLAVFVLGWAVDWRAAADAADALPPNFDAMAIYDYREGGCDSRKSLCQSPESNVIASEAKQSSQASLQFRIASRLTALAMTEIPSTLAAYAQTHLFAWSFGVMMAERMFGGGGVFAGNKFTRAVAINGTPWPVNEHFGIEPRRMAATLRGLARSGMEAFERKTYAEHYDRLLAGNGTETGTGAGAGTGASAARESISPRSLEDNIHELSVLCSLAEQPRECTLRWDEAIVGTRDEIFLPQNQLTAWGSLAKELPLPHYPFGETHLFTTEIFGTR